MRIGPVYPSRACGVAAMALAGSAALATACASGGGGAPPAGVAAEEIFAGLTGAWDVDTTTGTQSPVRKFRFEPTGPGEHSNVTDLGEAMQLAHRMAEEGLQRTMEWFGPVLEVWLDRPKTLILRVDEDRLLYVPAPGRIVEMPMSGEWVRSDSQRPSVRARVYWDDGRLAIERRVGSRGQVRSVLEIVDGRLQISRTLRLPRMSGPTPPYVLMYDRDEGGRDRTARRSRFGAGASRPSSRSP